MGLGDLQPPWGFTEEKSHSSHKSNKTELVCSRAIRREEGKCLGRWKQMLEVHLPKQSGTASVICLGWYGTRSLSTRKGDKRQEVFGDSASQHRLKHRQWLVERCTLPRSKREPQEGKTTDMLSQWIPHDNSLVFIFLPIIKNSISPIYAPAWIPVDWHSQKCSVIGNKRLVAGRHELQRDFLLTKERDFIVLKCSMPVPMHPCPALPRSKMAEKGPGGFYIHFCSFVIQPFESVNCHRPVLMGCRKTQAWLGLQESFEINMSEDFLTRKHTKMRE